MLYRTFSINIRYNLFRYAFSMIGKNWLIKLHLIIYDLFIAKAKLNLSNYVPCFQILSCNSLVSVDVMTSGVERFLSQFFTCGAENFSSQDWIYRLMCSPLFRKPAEQKRYFILPRETCEWYIEHSGVTPSLCSDCCTVMSVFKSETKAKWLK